MLRKLHRVPSLSFQIGAVRWASTDAMVPGKTLNQRLLRVKHPELVGELVDQELAETINFDSPQLVQWKCRTCSEAWTAAPIIRSIYKTSECTACRRARTRRLSSVSETLFREWNRSRNEPFLDPNEVAADSKKNVWWECQKCRHEWKARVCDRALSSDIKSKCPKCLTGDTNLLAQHPEIAAEWHPTANGDRLPQNYSTISKDAAWWICGGCGTEWEARIVDRCNDKNGCPKCMSTAL